MLLGSADRLHTHQAAAMTPRWAFSILVLVAGASPALAEPATPDGAKAIEQAYIDYFSKAVIDKGIVTVTPSGEDYVVAWDIRKALDLAGAPAGALRVAPFSYTLTPQGGGAWTVRADHVPGVDFDAPTDKGRVEGAVKLPGFRFKAAFDPAQTDFLRSMLGADALTAKFRIADTSQRADVDLAESDLSVETRAKASDSGAGVDLAFAQSLRGLTETVVSTPADDQGAPVKVSYEVGGVLGGLTVSGLRAREIGDLWKDIVAHADQPDAPADLKQRVRATLPLWNDVHAEAEIHDLALQTPFFEAKLRTLGERLGLSGFTAEGAAELGVRLDGLAFQSTALPPWAGSLSPVSLDLSLRVVDQGLDKAAQLALDDPAFGEKGDLSAETQEKIANVLLAGRPKLILKPGKLTTPIVDLAFEGETVVEAGAPVGHFTISADSLDKTIALLQEVAKSEPDAQSMALGVVFVKGLAVAGPDGRLVWKVDLTSSGEVMVNGSPLPTGK